MIVAGQVYSYCNYWKLWKKVHYATVTEAIAKLREQGFTQDFNIEGDWSYLCFR